MVEYTIEVIYNIIEFVYVHILLCDYGKLIFHLIFNLYIYIIITTPFWLAVHYFALRIYLKQILASHCFE